MASLKGVMSPIILYLKHPYGGKIPKMVCCRDQPLIHTLLRQYNIELASFTNTNEGGKKNRLCGAKT